MKIKQARGAEVGQSRSLAIQHDVVRFEIAMNDPITMQVIEPIQNPEHQLYRTLDRQGAALRQHLCQRTRLDVFAHEYDAAFMNKSFDKASDVVMAAGLLQGFRLSQNVRVGRHKRDL